jgi:hypothetical protein
MLQRLSCGRHFQAAFAASAVKPISLVTLICPMLPPQCLQVQPSASCPFQCLQHLHISNKHRRCVGIEQLSILQGLPASLTQLSFCWDGEDQLSAATAPDLAALTALQDLHLHAYSLLSFKGPRVPTLCPSILQHMHQLRHLNLTGLNGSVDVLLGALQNMQQLQHLNLEVCHDQEPALLNSPQQYAALTALRQLRSLVVSHNIRQVHCAVPDAGAAVYIFGPDKHLPYLTRLEFSSPQGHGGPTPHQPFGPGGLACMAYACPKLEQLHLVNLTQPEVRLQPLARLSALTDLTIGGKQLDGAEVAGVLVQMTQLGRLGVYKVPSFGVVELVQLTQLTALTSLWVQSCGLPDEMDSTNYESYDDEGVSLESQVGAATQHNICAQYRYSPVLPNQQTIAQLVAHVPLVGSTKALYGTL